MNLGNPIDIASAVIVVVVAMAATVAFFRANISKSTIDLYRQDNDALRARLITLEETVHDRDAKIAALEAQVTSLERTRTTLLAVVTQADQIARIERFARWLATREGFTYDT